MTQSPPYAPVSPIAPRSARSPLWALGLGIAALLLSWVPVLGLLLGLVAVIIGAVALAKAVRRTQSAVGLGLGGVALIIGIIVLAALGSIASNGVNAAATVSATSPAADLAGEPSIAATTEPTTKPTVTPTKKAAPTVNKPTTMAPAAEPVSLEQQNAIRSAQSYLQFGAFSRKGLIRQLSSDAGDGYTHSQAVYGVTKAGL